MLLLYVQNIRLEMKKMLNVIPSSQVACVLGCAFGCILFGFGFLIFGLEEVQLNLNQNKFGLVCFFLF